jgi:hypothetical protein
MNTPEDTRKTKPNTQHDSGQVGATPVDEARLVARDHTLWAIFADISQGLQLSSASIKAAVSSLLDTNIIWDRSAQHEFMQNIDQSIDRISSLMAVMTLAMKAESGQLELILEPCNVQEIIFRVVDAIDKRQTETSFALDLPTTGRPAFIDYDYMRIALTILLEALLSVGRNSPETIAIQAEEKAPNWHVTVKGTFTESAIDLLNWLESPLTLPMPPARRLPSEEILKAFTAYRLLELQHISLLRVIHDSLSPALTLVIPLVGEKWPPAAYS